MVEKSNTGGTPVGWVGVAGIGTVGAGVGGFAGRESMSVTCIITDGGAAAGWLGFVGETAAGELAAGIKTFAPQVGQTPRLPARASFTLSLWPLGQANRIPMALQAG
jgi:hypothetical protein